MYWSEQILDEATRNLVEHGVMTVEQSGRLRAAMTAAIPEALVTDHEVLIASMRNDAKDRHVAAAAVKAGAQVIVTANLDDFRDLAEGLEAQSPDEFLGNLFDLNPERIVEIVRDQAAALRRPPRTFDEVLRALQKIVPGFAASVRDSAERGGPVG